MSRYLVTGVSGLIGSHLVRELSHYGEIYGISRNKLSDDCFYHLPVDLSQNWHQDSLPKSVDAIIHLAQSEHFPDFPNSAMNIFEVNAIATLRLFDYARKVGAKTFILASSGGVYGYGDCGFSEEVEIAAKENLGFYLGTKLCSEILAENYTKFMNVIVLRFFFVYGTGQKTSMLIPRLVQSAIKEKPIILQGREGIKINPIHVSDAVTAIIRALNLNQSQKINIAGSDILSLRKIGEIIGRVVAKEPKFEVQLKEPNHLIGDIQKMITLLGAPRMRFEDGIKQYVGKL